MKLVKQKALLFIILINIIFFLPSVCLAKEIGVELIWKYSEASWLEIQIMQGEYTLKVDGHKQILKPGEGFKTGRSGLTHFMQVDNRLLMLEQNLIDLAALEDGIFRVRKPGQDWLSYRGDLVVTQERIAWKLINTLNSEDYLKGVVPIEMSNAWAKKGFEALKAQAVTARTYLIKNISTGGIITDSPNIHQAYLGQSAEGQASMAVEMTRGEILIDRVTGEVISVYYSAHNGGHTEETQNVWVSHDPHYPSFPDPFSVGVGGIVDRWQFRIAADTLGEAFDLAPIRRIELDTLPSGRVYQVHLYDWLGKSKAVSGGAFVQKFYPYGRNITGDSFLGRLFKVEFILPKVDGADKNPLLLWETRINIVDEVQGPLLSRLVSSNDGVSENPRFFGVYEFNGRGWGHGVGMSQWGAYNMAQQGYKYEDILQYYYKNAVTDDLD